MRDALSVHFCVQHDGCDANAVHHAGLSVVGEITGQRNGGTKAHKPASVVAVAFVVVSSVKL